MIAYCGACKKECAAISVDFGIGAYEFWGAKGVDKNVQIVSDCCEATVYNDEELTDSYDPDDDFDPPDDDDFYYDDDYDAEYIDNIADKYFGF